MKAGRELDALIAEKVMGWTWKTVQHPDCAARNQRHLLDEDEEVGAQPDGEWSYLMTREDALIIWSHMPDFSTFIADAWQVVEKMKEHGMHLLILSANDSGMVHCNFFKGTAGEQNGIAMDDTAPLAICKAALVACGAEVDA